MSIIIPSFQSLKELWLAWQVNFVLKFLLPHRYVHNFVTMTAFSAKTVLDFLRQMTLHITTCPNWQSVLVLSH